MSNSDRPEAYLSLTSGFGQVWPSKRAKRAKPARTHAEATIRLLNGAEAQALATTAEILAQVERDNASISDLRDEWYLAQFGLTLDNSNVHRVISSLSQTGCHRSKPYTARLGR